MFCFKQAYKAQGANSSYAYKKISKKNLIINLQKCNGMNIENVQFINLNDWVSKGRQDDFDDQHHFYRYDMELLLTSEMARQRLAFSWVNDLQIKMEGNTEKYIWENFEIQHSGRKMYAIKIYINGYEFISFKCREVMEVYEVL